MNSVMNGITNDDGEYQAILRKSDEYSGRLERIGLPVDVRQLIHQYVSEQNAPGSRYGMLAYLNTKKGLRIKALFSFPHS